MQEVNDDRIFNEQDANFYEQGEGQRTDESIDEVSATKEVKELVASGRREEANKHIAAFLRAKGLSGDLIKKLINADLTDEYVRLLRALDFNDDDIGNLRDIWRTKNEVSRSDDLTDSSTSGDSSLDAHMSQSSLYLKSVLSKPLIRALREIIATKPADPVEYLGHWLLHFKVSLFCTKEIVFYNFE
ncbi:uncharacterized protein LOC116843882 [Odontomachus brunneus]|uniref:uncharacterized protein LOC116843882 n=1 Tax=Odontomachus brunneus TaxID=486640 RepID=UPI0013F21081|nr:uncharacterized protein LOC116843882 [Odontomachus brunneus]